MVSLVYTVLATVTLLRVNAMRKTPSPVKNSRIYEENKLTSCLSIEIAGRDYCFSVISEAPKKVTLKSRNQVDIKFDKTCPSLPPAYNTLQIHYERKILANVIVLKVKLNHMCDRNICPEWYDQLHDKINASIPNTNLTCTLAHSHVALHISRWLQHHMSGWFIVFLCDHRVTPAIVQENSLAPYYDSFFATDIVFHYNSLAAKYVEYICNIAVLSPKRFACDITHTRLPEHLTSVQDKLRKKFDIDNNTNLIVAPKPDLCANTLMPIEVCTPFGEVIDAKYRCPLLPPISKGEPTPVLRMNGWSKKQILLLGFIFFAITFFIVIFARTKCKQHQHDFRRCPQASDMVELSSEASAMVRSSSSLEQMLNDENFDQLIAQTPYMLAREKAFSNVGRL